MTPDLLRRCEELIEQAREPLNIAEGHGDGEYWFDNHLVADLQAWIGSVANLFQISVPENNYFWKEISRVLADPQLRTGVPFHAIPKFVGLLRALTAEYKAGLLRKVEYMFVATTFDDFLGHADSFRKANKKMEAAVLASAVFEDSVRKFAEKSGVDQAGLKLDLVIDNLVKAGALMEVPSRRWKSYAAVRNKALHAQWDQFDIAEVGHLITGTRGIIELL